MINLNITKLNFNTKLKSGVSTILLENKEFFRQIYDFFDDEIKLSEEEKEISATKIFIVKQILDVDVNDKKSITELHKYLLKYIDINMFENKNKIISEIRVFLDSLIDNTEKDIEYDVDVDLIKIFQAFNIKYHVDIESIAKVLNFIKNIDFNKIKVLIIFNLSNYFNEKEIEIINKELQILDIVCLDISTKIFETNISRNYVLIDKDFDII